MDSRDFMMESRPAMQLLISHLEENLCRTLSAPHAVTRGRLLAYDM